jgi:hypothetical protein
MVQKCSTNFNFGSRVKFSGIGVSDLIDKLEFIEHPQATVIKLLSKYLSQGTMAVQRGLASY